MKIKTLNVFGIFAAAAMISSFAACKNETSKNTAATTKTESAAPVSASDKIVFVNSDSLLNKYDFYKDLKTKFDSKSKNAQSDLTAKGQAFQREVAQYQQQAQSLSADQRKATEERLARKQQELQAYQQNAGAAFQNEQAQENEKLYDRVADYLKKYAKEKGYKMVMSYTRGNGTILFADESLDVTSEVIKGLNEDYKSRKK
ncbi:outer membrane chaperone Skp [Pedobacter yulinensis]|uniref:Outer membrane chaperone Skp n=1 Tax=Pedobacter yulinensis TaxID=2126353 RepID=A0A2T3HIM9_9SPHI|nr:OmpH family outer membrane protein [Pedobacter yulinensis]PST82292.1 outer membrane chaperone Skp [Pedobacter yulinensis]